MPTWRQCGTLTLIVPKVATSQDPLSDLNLSLLKLNQPTKSHHNTYTQRTILEVDIKQFFTVLYVSYSSICTIILNST